MTYRKPFVVLAAVTYAYGSVRLAVDVVNWLGIAQEWRGYALAALCIAAYMAPVLMIRDRR